METHAILGLFALFVIVAVVLGFYVSNKRYQELGIHDELNHRKHKKERWELRGSRAPKTK